jgi:hypothetical protein
MVRALQIGDRAGIALAAACGLHCLATPLLALSMQAIAAAERTELALLASSLVLSGTLVTGHCLRRGASRTVLGAFLAGIVLLCLPFALAVPEHVEPVVGVAGSGLLVAAHMLRLVSCRCGKEGAVCVDTAQSLPSPRC